MKLSGLVELSDSIFTKGSSDIECILERFSYLKVS